MRYRVLFLIFDLCALFTMHFGWLKISLYRSYRQPSSAILLG